jgi:hypothetical protein
MQDSNQTQPRRYVWPWFVAGAVVLGVVLAVIWVSREVRRTREYRNSMDSAPVTVTNRN